MKTKECKICSKTKPLKQFLPLTQKKYYNSYCKSCQSKKQKEWKLKNPGRAEKMSKEWMDNQMDGFYRVYLIVNEHYVGSTNNLYRRTASHKNKGRDVSDIRVLYKTKSEDEAVELESLLHDLGYEGRHPKNKYHR